MGRIEINSQATINDAAIGLNKIQIGRLSRTEFTFAIESADRMHKAAEVLA
jgi:hypothetical protein